MKYCNSIQAKWELPCGYPRQWLDDPRGGCIVDDDAPCGIPCIIDDDGFPVRDNQGRIMSPVDEATTQYVLINLDNPYQLLGPFESIKLAQQFRTEHHGMVGQWAACRIRDAELWAEVLKREVKEN